MGHRARPRRPRGGIFCLWLCTALLGCGASQGGSAPGTARAEGPLRVTPTASEAYPHLRKVLGEHHGTDARVLEAVTVEGLFEPAAYVAVHAFSAREAWMARKRDAGTLEELLGRIQAACARCELQLDAGRLDGAGYDACHREAWPSAALHYTGGGECAAIHLAVLAWRRDALIVVRETVLEPFSCGQRAGWDGQALVSHLDVADPDGDGSPEITVAYRSHPPVPSAEEGRSANGGDEEGEAAQVGVAHRAVLRLHTLEPVPAPPEADQVVARE